MQVVSFYDDIIYNDSKPSVKLLMQTSNSKEIRIVMKANQEMKAHKAPFPIIVQVMEGCIEFGIEDIEKKILEKGMMIALDAHIVHNLIAMEQSLVRLSINIFDDVTRVNALTSK